MADIITLNNEATSASHLCTETRTVTVFCDADSASAIKVQTSHDGTTWYDEDGTKDAPPVVRRGTCSKFTMQEGNYYHLQYVKRFTLAGDKTASGRMWEA